MLGPAGRGRRVAPLLVLAALGAAAAASLVASSGHAAGAFAPSFSLARVGQPGAVVSSGDFAGRPVVVAFWASWCDPCRRDLPVLARAVAATGGRVGLVGVDSNDADEQAGAFLRGLHLDLTSASDPDSAAAKAFGVANLPTTVFVGADGRIQARRLGPLTGTDLGHLLARLDPGRAS